MKILNRITLIRSIVTQYAGEKFNVPFSTHHFNDGSYKVQIPEISSLSRESIFTINCHLLSLDDLMVVAQLVDIIRANTRVLPKIHLVLSSPAYMRYDRIMHEDRTDSFGLKVFAKMVKATGIDAITLIDPHSETARDLFELYLGKGCVTVLHQNDCMYSVMHNQPVQFPEDDSYLHLMNFEDRAFIIPDEGALKKQGGLGAVARADNIALDMRKTRNPETGEIIGIEPMISERFIKDTIESMNRAYNQDVSGNRRLTLVDDICEKGGTFIGIVKKLRSLGLTVPIDLYVTHGVFPDGTDWDELGQCFENIYVYGMSLDRLNHMHTFVHSNVFTKFAYNG